MLLLATIGDACRACSTQTLASLLADRGSASFVLVVGCDIPDAGVGASLGVWPSLYRTVIDALADLPVRVLVTTGEGVEVSQLGPLPRQTAVAAFVPQDHVLAHPAVMVAHGGFGTVLGGLRAGVPMVLAPLFAEQPHNAARVEEVGAGITVGTSRPETVVPPGLVPEIPASEIRAAVLRLLEDPKPRVAARRLANDMASHPSISSLVPLLERIASQAT